MEITGGMYHFLYTIDLSVNAKEISNKVGIDLSNKLINKITQNKSAIGGIGLLWTFKQFLIKKELKIKLFLSTGYERIKRNSNKSNASV